MEIFMRPSFINTTNPRNRIILSVLGIFLLSLMGYLSIVFYERSQREQLINILENKGYEVRSLPPKSTAFNISTHAIYNILDKNGLITPVRYDISPPESLTPEELEADLPYYRKLGKSIVFDISNNHFLKNVDALKELPNLTGLALVDCPNIKEINAVSECTKLDRIAIFNCAQLESLEPLKPLVHLEYINLKQLDCLTNLEFTRNLQLLEAIEIEACPHLTNLEGLHNLKSLNQVSLGKYQTLEEEIKQLESANPNLVIRVK